jgi:hypothetical protein
VRFLAYRPPGAADIWQSRQTAQSCATLETENMRHLSKAEIRAMSVEMPEGFQPVGKRHGAPFSKSSKGKARRNTRRAAIKRKQAWLS